MHCNFLLNGFSMDDSQIKNNNQDSQPVQLSSNSLKYYFCEADWALSRLISFIFNSIIFLFLISLSLISLGLEFIDIFEYKEGFADISTVEITFAISTIVLLKRYWNYSKQTSIRWWSKVTSPIICYGKFITITWLVVSLLAISDLKESTDYFNTLILQGQSYIQLLSFIFILISLYISVPSKKLRNKQDKGAFHKHSNQQQEEAVISQTDHNKAETENAQ
jgi:hypothetical protein